MSPTRTALRIAAGLDLPVDVVTQPIAILARRGAGKTYTASVIVEEVVCEECGPQALRIFGDDVALPCRHQVGRAPTDRGLFDRWATAGNRVQWRGRR